MPEDWSVLSRVPLPSVREARERLEQPDSRESRSQEEEQPRETRCVKRAKSCVVSETMIRVEL